MPHEAPSDIFVTEVGSKLKHWWKVTDYHYAKNVLCGWFHNFFPTIPDHFVGSVIYVGSVEVPKKRGCYHRGNITQWVYKSCGTTFIYCCCWETALIKFHLILAVKPRLPTAIRMTGFSTISCLPKVTVHIRKKLKHEQNKFSYSGTRKTEEFSLSNCRPDLDRSS